MSTNTNGLAIFDLPESFLMDLASEDESMTVFGGSGYGKKSKKKSKKSKKSDNNQDIIIYIINNNYNSSYSNAGAYAVEGYKSW